MSQRLKGNETVREKMLKTADGMNKSRPMSNDFRLLKIQELNWIHLRL